MRRAFAIAFVALGLTLASHAFGAGPGQDQPVLVTADRMDYDRDKGIVTATGHVEISQHIPSTAKESDFVREERVLRADSVSFNENTNVITAKGHVVLMEPSGEVVFADYAELTSDMANGVIHDLRLRMIDNSRMAAAGGRRENGVVTEMQKAVYSPCELCRDHPKRPPLWQVRGDRVVHDANTHDIEYYDAVLEVYGIPILYSPYLSAPDPTVKRRSGLLAPTYGHSSDLGYVIGIPYYLALDDSTDLVLHPIVTTRQGPVFSGEYAERFTHGELNLSGSVTDADFTNSSGTVDHNTLRGHIFGKGRFDLGDIWRAGFDLARASDDTYLARYNFPNQNVLTTRGFLEGFDRRNYADMNFYTFQGLRPFDSADTTPLVAPLIDYNYFGMPGTHGSYFTLDSSVLSLTRLQGVDSHRMSLLGGWHLPFTGERGDVFEITATTQADVYYVDNVPDPSGPAGRTLNGVTGRAFPQLALSWRYPLVRAYKTERELIEPIAAIIVGPNGSNPDKIPNEDSQSFEFDDANLFTPNRFPGVDQVDSGQRIDYGVNAGLYGKNGGNITGFLGESYRFEHSSPFLVGSGVEDQLSDFVGRVRISPKANYDVLYRFRLDKDTLQPRRNELSLGAGPPILRFGGSYLFLDTESSNGGFDRREELTANITSKFTDYWRVGGQTTQDLANGTALLYRLDLTYEDECFIMESSFVHSDFEDREIRPSTTFLVRFIFKHLGELKS